MAGRIVSWVVAAVLWWGVLPSLAQEPTIRSIDGRLIEVHTVDIRSLRLTSRPPGARVEEVDGSGHIRQLGHTPLQLDWPAGSVHRVRLHLDSFASQELELEAGELESKEVTLQPTTAFAAFSFNLTYRPWLVYPIFIAALGLCFVPYRKIGANLSCGFLPPPSEGPVGLGAVIGDYRLTQRLGGGAFSDVFRAEHVRYGDSYALKILKIIDDGTQRRFNVEMAAGRDFKHKNLVRIFGYGEHRERPYVVMECLQGETLSSRLREGRLEVSEALAIFDQMVDGLAYAHEAGVVHRDLKPDNVMLEPNGTVRLLDFGLAKVKGYNLTDTGITLGTPRYTSPDHLNSKAVDARADIYSLGVILFEMLTGRSPFDAEDPMEQLTAHLYRPPRPLRTIRPELPQALEDAIMRSLQKDRDQRFPTVRAMQQAVHASL